MILVPVLSWFMDKVSFQKNSKTPVLSPALPMRKVRTKCAMMYTEYKLFFTMNIFYIFYSENFIHIIEEKLWIVYRTLHTTMGMIWMNFVIEITILLFYYFIIWPPKNWNSARLTDIQIIFFHKVSVLLFIVNRGMMESLLKWNVIELD